MKPWVKIVLAVSILGVIAFYVVYTFVYNKAHPSYASMDSDYTLTATELFSAFKNNKAEAESKYGGKVLSIIGNLAKVETADSATICVFVFNQGAFGDEGIRCTMLPEYSQQAAKFQPDGEVKLKGYCTGYNDTDVILEKCSIENQ